MKDINMNYKISVFGDFEAVSVSPQTMMVLTNAFQEYDLIPNSFLEKISTAQLPIVRPRLDTVNNEWNIMVYGKRIDIQQRIVNEEGVITEVVGSFKEKALNMLQKMLDIFNFSFLRISFNTTSEKQDFNPHVYSKFIIPTSYYLENEPVEWTISSTARVVWKLAGTSTDVNVVSELSRKIDALKIQIDINTQPGNVNQQLDINVIDSFLKQALETRELLLNDLNTDDKQN
ncbi:hypothetical protein SPSYN_03014 [Sporotomaculum syntrophicum]|uniref:Uncharacterized protein n=1 Tax=Sporotomaculum syntrophicum TaxID=182264 RepID=A0A9D2WMD6_9FIRM|nr:hypothetical protein [Sporotomaculum syntrophicum]KAF1083858.1 hypothetical protein SPSYN_03014 [Sporotomaculum syntrophicum]